MTTEILRNLGIIALDKFGEYCHLNHIKSSEEVFSFS
jgi:hypothetical protein